MTQEYEASRAALEERLQLEAFIADCAARFTSIFAPSLVEHEIENTLRELAGVVRADRCVLLGGTPGNGLSWITCAASANGVEHSNADMNFATLFPWQFEILCGRRQPVVVRNLSDLPPEAGADRLAAEAMGVRSMLTVPVFAREGSAHCLMLQCLREERSWPEYYPARLRVLAEAFVNSLSRKRADETRQQLEGPHGDLLESVRAIVWRADPRTFQTTFVSKEAEAILGYPLECWVKVPGFWIDHVHPEDREWVTALSARAIEERRKHDFEYRMVVADGRIVWLRNIVNVLVENGQPIELVGVTTDITERKLAEFEAARLRHEAVHGVRVTILGELAATLAHELNQPLGAIVSNAETAQVLLKRVPPAFDQVEGILGDIAQDGQRAGAVLHRVRRLLQRQRLEMQPIDVGRLIDDVAGLARALALSRQIDLATEVEPALPSPCGDGVQIQQVLLNLILNAMEAVADRPAGQRHVTVRATRHGADGVELSVTDTGHGISREMLPRVFDPFFSTKTAGMGMGLAICRTIVQGHGGEIHAANDPAGGACVRFTLPAGVEPREDA